MAKKTTSAVTEQNVFSVSDINRLALAVHTIEECQRRAEGIAQTIAGELFVVASKRLYELDDCKSVADWAKLKFNISKGTVSDAISTFQRFGDGTTGKLLDRWQEYNYSTLMKMKKLSDEQIEMAGIKPTMSRSQVVDAIEALRVLEDKQKELPRLEKEWSEAYAELSKVMEVEDRMKLIQNVAPDFYDKDHVVTASDYETLINVAKSAIEELTEQIEDEHEDSTVEQEQAEEDTHAYEASIEPDQDETVESIHRFPEHDFNINYYRKENGSLDKKAILGDLWELIQGVENNDYIIVINKSEIPGE